MTQELSFSQRFRKGSGSVGTVLAVLVAVLIGYLTFKVQDIEKRVEKLTKSVATGGGQAVEVTLDAVKEFFDDKSMIAFGDSSKKILFTEAFDPGCPWCHVAGGFDTEKSDASKLIPVSRGGAFVPPTNEMHKLYTEGKASVGFIMIQTHSPNKLPLQAMYCAHEQNKFWEVREKLLTTEGYYAINPAEAPNDTDKAAEPTVDSLTAFVGDIVKSGDFKTCLQSEKYTDALAKSQVHSQALNLRGTPGMLLNTTQINWQDFEGSVKPLITSLLK